MTGNWPAASDFAAMLQNPGVAFQDPDLKLCTIERNPHNQPHGRSGAFAVVYTGTYTSGKKAGQDVCVRVFVKRSDERRERYSAISSYLRSRRLECLVGFEYQEKGIRANGKWWPLVTMDWVD
ncbi:MAG TPA: hypothetical protein VHB77_17845, partial [Planctomycetaceae bacterium]|nr:hypothetical protein [Planctomycetaceae bacterium]